MSTSRRDFLSTSAAAALGAIIAAGTAAAQRASAPDTTWRATVATAIPITRRLEGAPAATGPFRYYYQAPAGASLSGTPA